MNSLDLLLTPGLVASQGSLGAIAGLPAPVAKALFDLAAPGTALPPAVVPRTLMARYRQPSADAATPSSAGLGAASVPRVATPYAGDRRPRVRTRTSLMPGGQPPQEHYPPVPRRKPGVFPPTPGRKPLLPQPDPNLGGANPTYDPERVAQFFRDNLLGEALTGAGALGSFIETGALGPAAIAPAALYALVALMSGFGNSVELGYGENPIGP
jgi:hypothetical protein